ncbi:hypothetical protein NPIL_232491 [Nephila pilipes]|uniref:Uncharacterized protein n=1 Tax=Nephila pilipes TaxID=299642 RepID=A0A8X6TWU6_NEPPI|nr:hypothetical protein NPIL_232491 [Nephila pilipes]
MRHQLDYIDLFINGKEVKCFKDSGRKLIIFNKALFPEKPSTGSMQIKSCFGDIKNAETSNCNFSLDGNQYIELSTPICKQLVVVAIPFSLMLRVITKFTRSSPASRL